MAQHVALKSSLWVTCKKYNKIFYKLVNLFLVFKTKERQPWFISLVSLNAQELINNEVSVVTSPWLELKYIIVVNTQHGFTKARMRLFYFLQWKGIHPFRGLATMQQWT